MRGEGEVGDRDHGSPKHTTVLTRTKHDPDRNNVGAAVGNTRRRERLDDTET